MAENNHKDKVIGLSKDAGFDSAKYIGRWQDFEVYEPFFNDDKTHYIGMPMYILKNGNSIRRNTMDETRSLMAIFCIDEEDEQD